MSDETIDVSEKEKAFSCMKEDEWFKKRRWDLAGAAGLIAVTSFTAGAATAYYAQNKKGGDSHGSMVGRKKVKKSKKQPINFPR